MRVVTFDSCKTQSALSIKVWIVLNITESNLNKHGIMRIFFSKEIKDANRTACYHPRRVGIGVSLFMWGVRLMGTTDIFGARKRNELQQFLSFLS